jgi:hypothetical protein
VPAFSLFFFPSSESLPPVLQIKGSISIF